jgi:2-succinyl-5-enolpyruvyl-6-hydroxy-3-cyclohexene-1-carboxylate synthase
VSWRIAAEPSVVCAALTAGLTGAAGTPWLARWRHAEERAQAALAEVLDAQTALSEPAVARALTLLDATLVVGSSMPVRDLEWFGSPTSTSAVIANRGANGIEGVIATSIGVAVATGGPTAVLLGDVAFVHDSSSLAGLARRDVDLRIVVIDNDGGGIFSFLPQATSVPAVDFERLFGTPHGTDLLALARAHGLAAVDVSSRDELTSALAHRGSVVIRVRTDRAENVAVHAALNAAVVKALG